MTCCGRDCQCGLCRKHGRVVIEGYHGKGCLDLSQDSKMIKDVAALFDLNVNLSECDVPSIRATPNVLKKQLTLKPTVTRTCQIMKSCPCHPILLSACSSPCEVQSAFEQFFEPRIIKELNLKVCYKVLVCYDRCFSVKVLVELRTECFEDVVGYFEIVSTTFSLCAPSCFIAFQLITPHPVIILGDAIIEIRQLPVFELSTNLKNVYTLQSIQAFLLNVKLNTVSSFLSCNGCPDECDIF
jgi:hypothetical protein